MAISRPSIEGEEIHPSTDKHIARMLEVGYQLVREDDEHRGRIVDGKYQPVRWGDKDWEEAELEELLFRRPASPALEFGPRWVNPGDLEEIVIMVSKRTMAG